MRYVIYMDAARDYRWRLVSPNGNIISDSGEGYRNKADCQRGITLNKNSASAPVDDLTMQGRP